MMNCANRQSALAQSRDEHRDLFELRADRPRCPWTARGRSSRPTVPRWTFSGPKSLPFASDGFIDSSAPATGTGSTRIWRGCSKTVRGRSVEIEMRKTDGAVCHAQLISVRHDPVADPRCQTAVIDISFRKRIEEEMEDRIDGRTRELNALNMQLEQEIEWRKQTEERLDSELNFRTVIEETIPVGICVFDTNGRLLHANNHLCDMLGFSRAELLDTYPPYPFWPAESLLSRMAELKNFIEKDDVVENVVREYRKKTGEPHLGIDLPD